jgi:signal transduction histidine kinase
VLVGQLLDAGGAPGSAVALTAAVAVSFTTMGGLVLVAAPGHLVGRLMLVAGVTAGISVVAVSWAAWLPLAWLSQWSWWPPYGLAFLALLVFPNGRLPSRGWRPLAILMVAATVGASIALAVAALDDPQTLLTSGTAASTHRARLLVQVALGAMAVTVLGLVGVLWALWRRWRTADGQTRHQLACLLPAGVLLLLGVVLDTLNLAGAWVLMVVAVPAGMTVAVLRYRLYGLDQIVNRTMVWLVMTLLVIAGFVAMVALLRHAVMGGSTSNASLVATGVVAVAFEPLRRRVQRAVDRLLYGDRDDPYQVIARLGALLGTTVEPRTVPPLLTRTIADSLQVPYVAVEVEGRDGPRLLTEHGSTTTPVQDFDMVAHGERVGRLLVAARSTGSRFTHREQRLLGDLAQQAAVAIEATRLFQDLTYSRERLVIGREEERRRLRRELHDGLGPTLTGMSMQLRAAQKKLGDQPRVSSILAALEGDLQTCTTELRQLVDQLRPAVLDQGLEAALRGECQRFDDPGLTVRLHVQQSLEGLPAAVEVAAYRIVAEALTNVARHSRAGSAQVSVGRSRSLNLEIVDDGVGLVSPTRRGVGLDSMWQRAVELGGDCQITDVVPHGTAVQVQLPINATLERRSEEAAA